MKRFQMPESMKLASVWAIWWLLVGGSALWLLAGTVAYWVKHGWLPPDTSGWVQAFGSIGAVLVAILVTSREGRQRERERKRREFNYLIRVLPLATAATGHIEAACAAIKSGRRDNMTLRDYSHLLGIIRVELEGFSYTLFANDEVADGWLEIKSAVTILATRMHQVLGDPEVFRFIETAGFPEKANESLAKIRQGVVAYGETVGAEVWRDHHP